jgi:hypothetical protein
MREHAERDLGDDRDRRGQKLAPAVPEVGGSIVSAATPTS